MLEWMYWTVKSAFVVVALVLMLVFLFVWDRIDRSSEREKGFIPMDTSRGDRAFLGLVSMIFIGLAWLRFLPEVSMWGALAVSMVWMFIIIKFG